MMCSSQQKKQHITTEIIVKKHINVISSVKFSVTFVSSVSPW